MLTYIKIRAKITSLYYRSLIKLCQNIMDAAFAAGFHFADITKKLIRNYEAAGDRIFPSREPTSRR